MEMALFNVNDGFAEAVVRGYRSAFLTTEDYRRVGASDNLEGMCITLLFELKNL
jgi:V-type H+-transporting ATPase subunit d